MQFDYPHSLAPDAARARLEALGIYLRNRHGIDVTWSGDRGSFRGKYMVVNFQGELVLGDGVVHVTAKDPGMLWRKKARDYLERKLATYLDPGTAIADLPTG